MLTQSLAGTFSFESLVIFQDLRGLVSAAVDNPVVASFSRANASTCSSEALPHDLDAAALISAIPIPVLPTDSSQLEALTHSAAGRHLVVHGPPGTGKSQTIANLIADALSRNRRVLFVSAKMAALNVVYERLNELGLSLFCLEAHSTKAGKTKIVDELRRTLEAETPGSDGQLDEEFRSLLKVRNQLNAYVLALHRKIGPIGLTPFRAIGRLVKLEGAPEIRAAIPWDDPLLASREEYETCLEHLDELGALSAVFDRRADHPWRGFMPVEFGIREQEQIEDALATVSAECQPIMELAAGLKRLIPNCGGLPFGGWELFVPALAALGSVEELPSGWCSASVESLDHRAMILEQAGELRSECCRLSIEHVHLTKLSPHDAAQLYALGDTLYSSWYSVLFPSYRRWKSTVKATLSTPTEPTHGLLRDMTVRANRLLQIERWFHEKHSDLGEDATATAESLKASSRKFRCASALRSALRATGLERANESTLVSPEERDSASRILERLPTSNQKLDSALTVVATYWREGIGDAGEVMNIPLPKLTAIAGFLANDRAGMREWARVQRILTKSHAAGLTPFISAFESVSVSEAHRAFEKRFMAFWMSSAARQFPELGEFTEIKQNDLITRFRLLDERVRQLSILHAQSVASSASNRVRTANTSLRAGPSSEIAVLRYELQKKKRIKPLRRLFAEIPQVLQALKPCFLMSPLSVSTYLKPGAFTFDVVVFDEASQLLTAEAVPSILRASQVVVAGDPKQLPPTSFFESSLSEDELDADGDQQDAVPLESLLDDCAAVVPLFVESHLRWHYRSRDERLIQFSNHYFYDNRLVTFPAAEARSDEQGVCFVHVENGVWDRGRSRTNRREARIVARLAMTHFDEFPHRTLGIVAMNTSQKEAIEEALEDELSGRPDLTPFFDAARQEAVFVKSLENVQGDERDTMIISVGYGHDAEGGLSMNFGPINTEGGWRRLNVLVTRAKWKCVLVASIRAQELSGVNPNNRGAVALRNFLDYAERRGEVPTDIPITTSSETNDFEESVRETLVERGFSVDLQVGVGKFRIDLAVRRRDDPNRYLIGIECDGATYHSSRIARDRDILRQEVLERRGWRIHRVWSTEWFHDRGRAIAGLLRSIEQAESEPQKKTTYAVPIGNPKVSDCVVEPKPSMKNPPSQPRRYPGGVPYRCISSVAGPCRDLLLSSSCSRQLAETVSEVVSAEGPVAYGVLLERLKAICGVGRVGSNVQSNIDVGIHLALRLGSIEAIDGNNFFRAKGRAVESFRIPGDGFRRTVDQIPRAELGLAVLHLVEDQFGVADEYVAQAVSKLFGLERLRAEGIERIDGVVRELLRDGKLRRSGTQIYLA